MSRSSGVGLLAGGAQWDGGDHAGGDEVEAVAGVFAGGLVGEADAMQGGEQPVAGAVAGEDAAGAVAAVGRGGEAGDQEPRLG